MTFPFPSAVLAGRRFYRLGLLILPTLAINLLACQISVASSPQDKNRERPKLPYNMMGLQREEIEAYESKAEPVGDATAALVALNKTGWDMIHRYFPALGREATSEETEGSSR